MTSRPFTIAVIQDHAVPDLGTNVSRAEQMIRKAAAQGAQIVCLKELFNAPYFCKKQQIERFDLAESATGQTITTMQSLAEELAIVIVVPIFERQAAGLYRNSAAVIDADGTYLGKYRKTHIPQVNGFWEKFYFKPGNSGFPVFQTAVGRVGVYICYDRHFPEGWRALGMNGAQIVFNPSATSRGLSSYLWKLEQPASAVANMYFVGAINRVGIEPLGENDFYGTTYFVDPRGQFVGDVCSDQEEELIIRDLDLEMVDEVRNQWAFYRDRRPSTYEDLVTP